MTFRALQCLARNLIDLAEESVPRFDIALCSVVSQEGAGGNPVIPDFDRLTRFFPTVRPGEDVELVHGFC